MKQDSENCTIRVSELETHLRRKKMMHTYIYQNYFYTIMQEREIIMCSRKYGDFPINLI